MGIVRLWARFRGTAPWVQFATWAAVAWLVAATVVLVIGVRAVVETGGQDPRTGAGVPTDADDGAGDARTWTVVAVIDGDTVDVRGPDGTEERVRVAGIDTPERGECGFGPATSAATDLLLGAQVELVAGSRDDRDRYDRLVRYVEVDGTDVGLTLIEAGLAVARYDSRDGHGRHDREDAYVAADRAVDHVCS